jgi:hypothetical protein
LLVLLDATRPAPELCFGHVVAVNMALLQS